MIRLGFEKIKPYRLMQIVLVMWAIYFASCKSEKQEVAANDDSTSVAASTAAKFLSGECVDPDLGDIQEGVEISLCDGTLALGTMPACSESVFDNCYANEDFVAVEESAITAANLRHGVSIAGVTGSHRRTRHCKVGLGDSANIASPWDGGIYNPGGASVDVTGGSAVVTRNGGVGFFQAYIPPGSTVDFVNLGVSRTIVSVDTHDQFTVDSPLPSNFTGENFYFFIPGVPPYVDDAHGFGAPYVGPGTTNCDWTNFTDLTNSGPGYQPDTSKYATWTKIGRDELSGIEFTNALEGTRTAAQGHAICQGLNGGTGGDGWRLPDQKELYQLYIDGISHFDSSFDLRTNNYGVTWSSTVVTLKPQNNHAISLGNGFDEIDDGKAKNHAIVCVR